ncbi:MAG TPA: nuclear transport factor 2 family protein [Thermoanaerobaculia bacterium]|jgi:ketosteroid isomerase-like protein|nr:nuclear transport factor 2 family protein [Thermoanaerobaculia bacterium]
MPSPEEAAVAAANLAFYSALQARNLPRMEAIWSHEDPVTCVHPGWHRLDGWPEVRRSWENIFANSRAWTVGCEDVRIAILGDLAWVVCVEVLRPFGLGEDEAAARMQATNVFLRRGGAWRMVHHHASASPSGADEDEDETVN